MEKDDKGLRPLFRIAMMAPQPWQHRETIVSDSDHCSENALVEFRLTYEGRLARATRGGADHRHEIRRVFHKQLKRFWDYHPFFKDSKPWVYNPPRPIPGPFPESRKEQLAAMFSRCGYKFVPIVSRDLCVYCSLDVLFLRPDPPGELILSGDIDNRIKSLIDALKMPGGTQDLGSYTTPLADEDPFFVLLEDDRLVTRLVVETDMLLQPTGPRVDKQDCRLVIKVNLTPFQSIWGNTGV